MIDKVEATKKVKGQVALKRRRGEKSSTGDKD